MPTTSFPIPNTGAAIRAARDKRGLTQNKAAKLSGVSRRHLAALEKGANVSVVLLMKVAAALELPVLDVGDDLRLVLGERTGASSAALLDCADEIEEGIARSQKVVTKLRETAEGKADDNDPLRVRASALLQSFLKEVRSLDAAEQVERLQGLTVQATRPRKRSKKVS